MDFPKKTTWIESEPQKFTYTFVCVFRKKASKNHTNLCKIFVFRWCCLQVLGTFFFMKISPAFGAVHLPLRVKTPPFRLSDLFAPPY